MVSHISFMQNYQQSSAIRETVMPLCQHMCFWTFVVNKSLFAATNMDLQYFGHILV